MIILRSQIVTSKSLSTIDII